MTVEIIPDKDHDLVEIHLDSKCCYKVGIPVLQDLKRFHGIDPVPELRLQISNMYDYSEDILDKISETLTQYINENYPL